MRSIRDACGDDFAAMWAELDLGEQPDWLDEDDQTTAMGALLQAFVQVQNDEQMIAFWQAVPTEMEEPFIEVVEALIMQAEEAGDADAVEALRSRLEGFQQIRQDAALAVSADEPLLTLLEEYQAALQAADIEQPDVAAWRAVVDLGERLLAMQIDAGALLDWDALRKQISHVYNTLGNAHDTAGDPVAALTAFERAIELQPGFAMWRRNQASMLIELGRLDEAVAAIAAARGLEPDAPRLAQLEAELAAARGNAGGEATPGDAGG